MKFGGTSVGKPERMHEVAKLITTDPEKKIVVLSALSGTTNALVEIGQSAPVSKERKPENKSANYSESHTMHLSNRLLETEKARRTGPGDYHGTFRILEYHPAHFIQRSPE